MREAAERAGDYAAIRDLPGLDATTRLSPALHFGTVSARELEILLAHKRSAGAKALRRQLAWRDFWLSVIRSSPGNQTLEYDARLQSMRGNNTPFSHATAFHEVIPGHNLVGYVSARYRGYRPSLGGASPFYGEGWPLYWEITMYDIGFHDTPEKRIGALFWRMHRCARIIFSLKFHMGEWSPQECVDFLVDRVGFERENAIGEVRRSFQGGYGPLYQLAYLMGGIQMRAMRKELVDSGLMEQKAFHDEVLRQGSMPIALLRLAVGRQKLTRDTAVEWKFYGQKIEDRR